MQFMPGWVDYYSHDDADPSLYFHHGLGGPKLDIAKISNLGVCKLEEITDMVFHQDLVPAVAAFMINVVLSPAGGLNFVWTYASLIDFCWKKYWPIFVTTSLLVRICLDDYYFNTLS